jgi:hypothetical protein
MKKFKITFKHTVENTYEAVIEAHTKEEALKIFDYRPFEYLEDDEPIDIKELSIDIINTEKI